ncbi:MAG TPA: hypothetical protein VF628_11365 [Allosphingosinicella sp.]|jgi:hypothetical protein
MLRFAAGVVSALLLVAAGFFIWKSRAQSEQLIPPAPAALAAPSGFVRPLGAERIPTPPEATPKSREEKRFARADKDDDGRITRAELLEPRRKAFAKLDTNGNGALSFEEWTVKTADKFGDADANRDGALTAAEYATTAPKKRPKPKCGC